MNGLIELFGTNVEVLNEDENQVREIMGRQGYKPPERVMKMPEGWWEELPTNIEFIINSNACKLLSLLKDEGVEWTQIRLWHSPHEKDKMPDVPEDIEIDWSSILKVLEVIASAIATTVTFALAAVSFVLIALFAVIDPWVVIDLPSGVMLKIYEYED